MGQTSYSSSSFWAKQIGIAVVLVIAAGVLIYMIQNQEQAPAPESQKEEKSVSKGLSEFYRDFRMSATDPQEDEQGDFVIGENDCKICRMHAPVPHTASRVSKLSLCALDAGVLAI